VDEWGNLVKTTRHVMGWCRGGEERRHTEAVDEGVDSGEARRG